MSAFIKVAKTGEIAHGEGKMVKTGGKRIAILVSLRNWASESDRVRRADYCVESLPMASLSWRHHPLVRAVVLEVPDLVCPHG